MALMSTQTSNSFKHPSSETPYQHKYEVFLSFRGDDVRDNFLAHLHRALYQKGINSIFIDNVNLEHGIRINDGLFKAIEESRFSIVVLSKNYADSSWCLRELVHILKCKRHYGLIVYPIFYHVSPSNVRKQEGAFGKGFAKACSKKEKEDVKTWIDALKAKFSITFWEGFTNASLKQEDGDEKRWRDALEEVGNLKGWDFPNTQFENEAKLIDDIVHKIFDVSNDRCRILDEDLVGISSRMKEVITLLELGLDKTRVVGLWGMAGVGKTTLAKAVYDYISWQFEGCSFIENVRGAFERSDVSPLQQHLISDILKDENFNVQSAMRIIQNRVCRKKVLIVLDDVSNVKQVEDLVGNLKSFCHPKTRIIITSQDIQVLSVCGVQLQHVFNVQKLNKDEAIQLFKSKAFSENGETGEFHTVISRALQYADGVPFALKVLGSLLLGGTVTQWGSLLDRLGNSLDDELQKLFKISYDGLDWTDKQIFLDICCFFKGLEKSRAVKILDGCDFNAEHGISVLVKKSLLTISVDDRLLMHDLVQKMGWTIVLDESRNEPGERSRLWHQYARQVISQNTGTRRVEGFWLSSSDNLQLNFRFFATMPNLRILKAFGISIADFPNELRCFHWVNCPLKCMPPKFDPQYLVELSLPGSSIGHLWNKNMELPKLSLLDLSGSESLTKSPEFSGFPNLQNLVLQGCTGLKDIHPSIRDLEKLVLLDLKDCTSLQILPYGFKSQCFEILIFSGCLRLGNILECFGELKRLWYLDLDRTGITELPESIGSSTNLLHLTCSRCYDLRSIPSSIGQLKKLTKLSLNGCSSLTELPEEVGFIHSLLLLDLKYSGLSQLPDSLVLLRNLRELYFQPSTSRISNFTSLDFSGFLYLTKLDLKLNLLTSVLESISLCVSLKDLKLSGDFKSLPIVIKNLINLETLQIYNCNHLQELPELPPNVKNVQISGCRSLRTVCSPTVLKDAQNLKFIDCPKLVGCEEINVLLGINFLSDQIKENDNHTIRTYVGPGSRIPERMMYKSRHGVLKFVLDIKDSKLFGLAFSAVVEMEMEMDHYRGGIILMKVGIGGKTFELGGDAKIKFPHGSRHVVNFFCPIEWLIVDDLIQTSGTDMEYRRRALEFDDDDIPDGVIVLFYTKIERSTVDGEISTFCMEVDCVEADTKWSRNVSLVKECFIGQGMFHWSRNVGCT